MATATCDKAFSSQVSLSEAKKHGNGRPSKDRTHRAHHTASQSASHLLWFPIAVAIAMRPGSTGYTIDAQPGPSDATIPSDPLLDKPVLVWRRERVYFSLPGRMAKRSPGTGKARLSYGQADNPSCDQQVSVQTRTNKSLQNASIFHLRVSPFSLGTQLQVATGCSGRLRLRKPIMIECRDCSLNSAPGLKNL